MKGECEVRQELWDLGSPHVRHPASSLNLLVNPWGFSRFSAYFQTKR
jgi:hypothetical protein